MNRKLFYLIVPLVWMCSSVQAQDWQTDWETAQQLAAEKQQNVVLVFQGSDWCAPCIKLDKEVWSTEEFKAFAQDHFVMLRADFPRKKKNALSAAQQEKNKQLADTYNQQGYFPLVVVLDAAGKVLGQTGYKKLPPAEYIELLTSFEP